MRKQGDRTRDGVECRLAVSKPHPTQSEKEVKKSTGRHEQ